MNGMPQSSAWPRQVTMFCAAGALNTTFGFAAFALLKWIGFQNDRAVICSTVLGVAFNFGTFRTAFASSGLSRVPHFVAFYAINTAVNISLLRSLGAAGVDSYLGEALTIAVIAPFAFLAMRRFVFPQIG